MKIRLQKRLWVDKVDNSENSIPVHITCYEERKEVKKRGELKLDSRIQGPVFPSLAQKNESGLCLTSPINTEDSKYL